MYYRFVSPVTWILTFFVILFIYSKFFGPISFSINSVTTQKSDTFNVSGEGKVIAPPDIAIVTVGIQASSATVKAAQDQINAVINRVSSSIKDLGVESKDIQTTNYNINPDYDFASGNQRIKGYVASTNLSIAVREIDKANEVIDMATSSGANQVGGISFDVLDKAKLENEAREKAVADAKKKAQDAAKIAGFKLGKIVNYSESSPGPISPMPFSATRLDKAVGTPTEIEPGSTDIRVSVTLSYELQ